MADSSIAITGGNVDTRTAGNGDHRQVIVLGADGDTVALINSDQELYVRRRPANLHVTATAAAAAAATATLPAGGAGLFHYITRIAITAYTTAARTGSATALVAPTTTNIPGSMVWTFATAAAIGTTDHREIVLDSPIKSSVANTATTIVGTGTTGIIWRIAVDYYLSV